jgi:hypothetical protein
VFLSAKAFGDSDVNNAKFSRNNLLRLNPNCASDILLLLYVLDTKPVRCLSFSSDVYISKLAGISV